MLPFYILFRSLSLNCRYGNALSQSKTMRLLYCWVYRGLFQFVHVNTCPTWTSPNTIADNLEQILESDVQNPQKGTFTIHLPYQALVYLMVTMSRAQTGAISRLHIWAKCAVTWSSEIFFAQNGYRSSPWGLPIDQQPQKTILSLYIPMLFIYE